MKKFVCLMLAVATTGCINSYRYQEEQEQKALDQANLEKLKCMQHYEEGLEFALIRPMIPYNPENATFAQLSSKAKPTKAEKVAIEGLDSFSQQCYKTYMFYYKAYNPSKWRYSLAEAYQQNQRELLLRLYDGQLSYGEYATQRIKLLQKRNEIEEEESRKRRQGMINDLLMLQAVGAFSAPVPVAPAPVAPAARPFNAPGTVVNPIQTNCSSMGGSVNCQTFSY